MTNANEDEIIGAQKFTVATAASLQDTGSALSSFLQRYVTLAEAARSATDKDDGLFDLADEVAAAAVRFSAAHVETWVSEPRLVTFTTLTTTTTINQMRETLTTA